MNNDTDILVIENCCKLNFERNDLKGQIVIAGTLLLLISGAEIRLKCKVHEQVTQDQRKYRPRIIFKTSQEKEFKSYGGIL